MPGIQIVHVTPENVAEVGVYCIKNKKAEGYQKKLEWFQRQLNNGLTLKILADAAGKQMGFIEVIDSELSWRPINATNYLFIQCLALFGKAARNKKNGSALLKACEDEARKRKKAGICSMSSNGAWMANKSIFEKNGYNVIAKQDRFELMSKKFDPGSPDPTFRDWNQRQADYNGWNLVYSHQCPWHEKSVQALKETALAYGVDLKLTELKTPQEAQQAPSGYGTFSLIKDGVLLEDHYLSKTRFETILKKETN